jgi:hypothetical protein
VSNHSGNQLRTSTTGHVRLTAWSPACAGLAPHQLVPRSGGHLSDDEEPFRGDVLEIEAEQDRSGATITLVGEVDMTGSERFWAFVR